MRRYLVILFTFCISLLCYAQNNTARVTLKNGTTYSGKVVELDPQSHITILIAGIETRIDIGDVGSIEDATSQSISEDLSHASSPITTEKKEQALPDNYTIEIGPYKIKMVLVKGSVFSMGYDGKGSQSMRSEPVHSVELSDYYVNSAPLEKDLVNYIKGKTKNSGKLAGFYHPSSKADADLVASKIAQHTHLPIRLITEAQWEYLATNKTRVFVFHYFENEQNCCFDSYREYSATRSPQLDPCPKGGPNYVIRQLSPNKPERVFQRYPINPKTKLSKESAIRITFPATAILK